MGLSTPPVARPRNHESATLRRRACAPSSAPAPPEDGVASGDAPSSSAAQQCVHPRREVQVLPPISSLSLPPPRQVTRAVVARRSWPFAPRNECVRSWGSSWRSLVGWWEAVGRKVRGVWCGRWRMSYVNAFYRGSVGAGCVTGEVSWCGV